MSLWQGRGLIRPHGPKLTDFLRNALRRKNGNYWYEVPFSECSHNISSVLLPWPDMGMPLLAFHIPYFKSRDLTCSNSETMDI